MTKKRIILRLVTFVLTLLLAFYAVPVYAYASDSPEETFSPVCDEQKVEQNEEEQSEDTYDDYGRLVGKTHGARETGE